MAGAAKFGPPRGEPGETALRQEAHDDPAEKVVDDAGEGDDDDAAQKIETHPGDEVEHADRETDEREERDGGDHGRGG